MPLEPGQKLREVPLDYGALDTTPHEEETYEVEQVQERSFFDGVERLTVVLRPSGSRTGPAP